MSIVIDSSGEHTEVSYGLISKDRSSSNDNRSTRRRSSASRRINPACRLLLGRGRVTGGVFHQRHVDGRAFFSGDTEPAGAGRATEVLPSHPFPSSATAPASINAPAADGPGESGPYAPAFRGVLPGGMFGFSAEGVAVDEREKWCQVSLSVPGAADMTAVDAVAILDSGSGVTTMSAGIANKLQAAFPGVRVLGGMAHPEKLKMADGRVLVVQKRTCPVRIALHTSWGLVTMEPFSFAAKPGDDDVVIPDNRTLKLLGIDVYGSLGARARKHAALTGVDTAAFWPRRVCIPQTIIEVLLWPKVLVSQSGRPSIRTKTR